MCNLILGFKQLMKNFISGSPLVTINKQEINFTKCAESKSETQAKTLFDDGRHPDVKLPDE